MNKENRLKVYTWIAERKGVSISVASTIYKWANKQKRAYYRQRAGIE